MRPFAEFKADNFRSYYTLAEAERARADGDSDGAVGGYLRTIEHAGTHGYVLLEAFANELLGRHYRERGHRFAVAHFEEARALYLECGARGAFRVSPSIGLEFISQRITVARPILQLACSNGAMRCLTGHRPVATKGLR